jgi:mRNA interferase MazF
LSALRGELWWASLDPVVGSEQGGRRPVLIFQNNAVSEFTKTLIAIPVTTSLRRSRLPSSVFVRSAGTGLTLDSVVLCHQIRVIDQTRLHTKIGVVTSELLQQVAYAVLFTLGIATPSK